MSKKPKEPSESKSPCKRWSDVWHLATCRTLRLKLPCELCVHERSIMMLKSLLRPCHARLTTRCWQKQGRHAWLQAHCQPACTDSQFCRFYCRPRCNRITRCYTVAHHPANVAQELPELTDQRMSWRGRSIGCGDVSEDHIGQRITVCGWVHRHRGLGGVVFCDIRDSSGLLQVCSCALSLLLVL